MSFQPCTTDEAYSRGARLPNAKEAAQASVGAHAEAIGGLGQLDETAMESSETFEARSRGPKKEGPPGTIQKVTGTADEVKAKKKSEGLDKKIERRLADLTGMYKEEASQETGAEKKTEKTEEQQ